MLWIKAFHIVFVISWFAGLFYLPRIFVNLAMIPGDSSAERERLLLMARKLYRFTMGISVIAVAFGLWLLSSAITTTAAACCATLLKEKMYAAKPGIAYSMRSPYWH